MKVSFLDRLVHACAQAEVIGADDQLPEFMRFADRRTELCRNRYGQRRSRRRAVLVDEPLVFAAGLKQRLPGLSVSRDGHLNLSMAATVAPAMRCLYVDLDGTLLGPDAGGRP